MERLYKNRIDMFDTCKGIAMVVILSMYTISRYDLPISNIIQILWIMLAFPGTACLFFIMGYWFKPAKVSDTIKEVFGSVLRLYAITGLAAMVFVVLLGWTRHETLLQSLTSSMAVFLGYILGYDDAFIIGPFETREIGGMWYILVYALGMIGISLLTQIKQLKDNRVLILVVLFVLSMVGILISRFYFIPFCIPEVLVAMQTMFYGYILKCNGKLLDKWKAKEWLILILGSVLSLGIMYALSLAVGTVAALFDHTGMLFSVPLGIMLTRFGMFLQEKCAKAVGWLKVIGSKAPVLIAIFAVETVSLNWSIIAEAGFMPKNQTISMFTVLAVRIIMYVLLVVLIDRLVLKYKKVWYMKRANK